MCECDVWYVCVFNVCRAAAVKKLSNKCRSHAKLTHTHTHAVTRTTQVPACPTTTTKGVPMSVCVCVCAALTFHAHKQMSFQRQLLII